MAGLRDLTILLNVNSSLLTSHINASISATVWTLDFILDLTDVTLTHCLQHLKPPNLHTTREALKKIIFCGQLCFKLQKILKIP